MVKSIVFLWGVLGCASLRLFPLCGSMALMLAVYTVLNGVFVTPAGGPPTFPGAGSLDGLMVSATSYAMVAAGVCGAVAGLFVLMQR